MFSNGSIDSFEFDSLEYYYLLIRILNFIEASKLGIFCLKKMLLGELEIFIYYFVIANVGL
jgi:hypothetical protein